MSAIAFENVKLVRRSKLMQNTGVRASFLPFQNALLVADLLKPFSKHRRAKNTHTKMDLGDEPDPSAERASEYARSFAICKKCGRFIQNAVAKACCNKPCCADCSTNIGCCAVNREGIRRAPSLQRLIGYLPVCCTAPGCPAVVDLKEYPRHQTAVHRHTPALAAPSQPEPLQPTTFGPSLTSVLRNNLTCPVCCVYLVDPVACSRGNCHQTFCGNCAQSWKANMGHQATCPSCREDWCGRISFSAVPEVGLVVSNLPVSCTFHAHGCRDAVTLSGFSNHIALPHDHLRHRASSSSDGLDETRAVVRRIAIEVQEIVQTIARDPRGAQSSLERLQPELSAACPSMDVQGVATEGYHTLVNPVLFEIHVRLADCARCLEQFTVALNLYTAKISEIEEKLGDHHPLLVEAFLGRAEVHKKCGQYTLASSDIRTALALQSLPLPPETTESGSHPPREHSRARKASLLNLLGDVERKRGNFDAAEVAYYQALVELSIPTPPGAIDYASTCISPDGSNAREVGKLKKKFGLLMGSAIAKTEPTGGLVATRSIAAADFRGLGVVDKKRALYRKAIFELTIAIVLSGGCRRLRGLGELVPLYGMDMNPEPSTQIELERASQHFFRLGPMDPDAMQEDPPAQARPTIPTEERPGELGVLLTDLADVLRKLNRNKDAVRLCDDAIECLDRKSGIVAAGSRHDGPPCGVASERTADHGDALYAKALAVIELVSQGELVMESPIDLIEEAERIYTRVFCPNRASGSDVPSEGTLNSPPHFKIGLAKAVAGMIHSRLSNFDAAYTKLDEAVKLLSLSLGPDDLEVADARIKFVETFTHQMQTNHPIPPGLFRQCKIHLEQAARVYRAALLPTHQKCELCETLGCVLSLYG